jgi:hypothetical protein
MRAKHWGEGRIELHRSELEGIHDAQTSINYSHRISLGDFLVEGSSVRATFTIIGGNRFQINGLALCSSPWPVDQNKISHHLLLS